MDSPISIPNRQTLLSLIAEAAELEHTLCCSYLFAAFSLKRDTSEGITAEEAATTRRWKRTLSEIATQEMRHLALANNLLIALGAGPHFRRPNFPVPARYYPREIQLGLVPFSEQTLAHFIYVERPEDVPLRDAPAYEDQAQQQPASGPRGTDVTPMEQDYETVNALYRGIEANLCQLAQRYGEAKLFVGPVWPQATAGRFQFDGLAPVRDLASARGAIELIVSEGEGDRGNKADSHFGRFVRVQDEYRARKRQRPAFEPARPVLEHPFVHQPADAATVNLIDDPYTVQVSELCNAVYETVVQVLTRFFLHAGETEQEVQALSQAAVTLMSGGLTPLGEMLTTLPAGPSHAGATAGPSFEFYRAGYSLPHKQAAWLLLHERLQELASACGQLACTAAAPLVLTEVHGTLSETAALLGRYTA